MVWFRGVSEIEEPVELVSFSSWALDSWSGIGEDDSLGWLGEGIRNNSCWGRGMFYHLALAISLLIRRGTKDSWELSIILESNNICCSNKWQVCSLKLEPPKKVWINMSHTHNQFSVLVKLGSEELIHSQKLRCIFFPYRQGKDHELKLSCNLMQHCSLLKF